MDMKAKTEKEMCVFKFITGPKCFSMLSEWIANSREIDYCQVRGRNKSPGFYSATKRGYFDLAIRPPTVIFTGPLG